MDTMDDAWSYSYPSSLESLPLPPLSSTNGDKVDSEVAGGAQGNGKPNGKDREKLKIVTEQPKEIKLESPIALRRDSTGNDSTKAGSSPPKPSAMSAPQPALLPRHRNSTTTSQNNLAKSAPADPHTTKHDVESLPADNSSTSSINDTATDLAMIQNQSPPSTPVQGSNFFNNMISTLSFNKGKDGKPSTSMNSIDENGVVTVTMDSHSRTNSHGGSAKDSTTSPSMLSYRRDKRSKRRNTSASSIDIPKSPLVEDKSITEETSPKSETFDTSNYVDEKFKDTSYRYATITRNNDFHKLFKSIPADERLLDDFSCALSREILLQGRLYVTEKNICFNSNLLGWVTNLVIPYADISKFEKTATAGLFPNGIAINLNNGNKHYFASFLSRDSTYNLLTEVWEASDDQANNLSQVNTNSFQSTEGEALVSKDLNLGTEKYDADEYQKALLSIDGDTRTNRRNTSGSDEFYDDDDDDDDDEEDDSDESSNSEYSGSGKVSEAGKVVSSSQQVVYKAKNTSVYAYTGPDGHQSTSSGIDYTAMQEVILAEENIKCPPGLLFEILFGPNNDLTLQFLGSQGGSNFSKFSDYERNDEGKKERNYNYTKALNYSIGPKSTKCYVQEAIVSLDYDGCTNVLSTTKTPDVPSGNAFSVKTRYVMTWGPENTTDLVISFKVDWTGKSWVKSMIDKSCLSGQEEATKQLIPLVKKIVDDNTFATEEEIKIENNIEPLADAKRADIDAKSLSSAKVTPSTPDSFIPEFSAFNIAVLALLSGILLLQVGILRSIRSVPEKTFSFGVLSEIDKSTENVLFKGEEVLLWNWLNERAGNLDLSQAEKTGVLKNDIDQVINKWVSNDLNSKESKKLIKTFEHHLNSYSEKALNKMKDEQHQQKAAALKAAIKALL